MTNASTGSAVGAEQPRVPSPAPAWALVRALGPRKFSVLLRDSGLVGVAWWIGSYLGVSAAALSVAILLDVGSGMLTGSGLGAHAWAVERLLPWTFRLSIAVGFSSCIAHAVLRGHGLLATEEAGAGSRGDGLPVQQETGGGAGA